MDRYLNFSSHHPLTHKKSVIASLFSHATTLSSSTLDCAKEHKHITRALRNNGYPTCFIQRSATHAHTPTPPASNDPDEQKLRATVTILYVQGLSEPIKWLLQRLDVKVRLRPNRTLCQLLVRPKDRVYGTTNWNCIQHPLHGLPQDLRQAVWSILGMQNQRTPTCC